MGITASLKWAASLSTGETVVETEQVPGESSPWQKLLQRCRDEDIQLTGLRLGPVAAMPQKMCDGYFQASKHVQSVFTGKSSTERGIGSVVGDLVFVTWLTDSGRIYQEIMDLATVAIHCYRRNHAREAERRAN